MSTRPIEVEVGKTGQVLLLYTPEIKRPLPHLNFTLLQPIFTSDASDALCCLDIIARYYESVAVGDSFGCDHDRRWHVRDAVLSTLSPEMQSAYFIHNKFRINIITSMLLSIEFLSHLASMSQKKQLAQKIISVHELINNHPYLKDYHYLDSLDRKYELVCFIDECIALIFSFIAEESLTNY